MKNNHLIKYTIMFVVFAVFIIAEAFASMIVVTTTSDEASDSTYGSSTGTGISLREAVMQAADNPGDDDIFLNSGSTYTLTIAGRDENSNLTGDIDISDSSGSVTIHGKNAIVQAGTNNSNGIDRMFHIVSGTVYINRLTLRYGLVTGSTWTESGGAIYDSGTTTMKNCSLHDNSAEYSAGAFSNRSGTLNLIQCTIYNNTGSAGGGAFNGIGATLNITNCTISGNNTTGGSGYGFLYNDGNVNMMNTTLSNNCEFSSIYRRNGIFTITNCLIEGALSSSSNGVGEIYSGGYNIIGYLKSDIFNETTGDIVGTDSTPANIGINTTLTNNGGPTDTHALLSTSDGRDTGSSSSAPLTGTSVSAPLRDQRGYLRSSIDKGSFEYGATASSAPTDIIISSNSVDHNSPSDTTVGTLSATDSDSGETYSFVLVPGTGSTDNDSFYIDGNLLKTKEVIDYNTKSSYSIRLWVDDGISTYEKQMTISVNPNNPPTDISLSSDTIDENMAAGTSIGDFSTTDVDTLDTHTYTFGSGTGDTDNASFAISGNTLQSAAEFDYETKNSYSIRVRTTDISGDYYDKIFTITINDMNDSFFCIDASTTQNQTQPISIPITMNNLTNIDIQAIELNISYNPAVLTATGISLTGTVLENENFIYDYNTNIPGIIYTGFMSNASHFTGTGLCLYADFTVIGASGETSDITISTAIINNQVVSTSDGIFTVAPDSPPIFTGMIPHTINEDALLSTSLTITDYETNPCDLTLTITSSDETLVPANTISYTCQSGNYYFAITPVADQYGLATITIVAEDSNGLTASESFDLTVVSVNDAPVISANSSLTMNEDISSAFSLTATDIETAGCSLGLTWQSSNSSILPDDNISYTCTGDVFQFSLTPVDNQFGNLTLSFTITDAGAFTETHDLAITVVEVNDTPLIGTVSNQFTNNRMALSAISITATDIETATCSLGMSLISSNPVLIPTSNISYTCASNSFYFTLTPVTGQSGSSTITLVVTDSGGLTASTSFILNVNLPPELSYIPNSGTAAGEFSFTFVEAEGDSVSVTVTSSNQSLISDATITINGVNSNTIELTTTAEMEQAISISLPQESNVHGLATITITASAIGGTVSETFNVIVSPPGSGNALTFDGDDDFIAFGSIDGSHPLALAGSQFSMAFWIKPAITGDSFQRIIDKSTAGLAADGYLLCLNTGNSLKFYLNGMARFTTDSNVLTANMWHHVVVTGDASQYKCYVNGIAVGLTTENSFELPPYATANLYIGTWYTESTREYHGQMDEISIWNVALSEANVRNYMCSRLTGNETGLLAYFRFDNYTGTTLTDLSGNNFHGTLTNMDNASWNISEAPLGNTSINDYVGSVATDFSVNLSHSDGDAFTALGDSGTYSGLHIYLVNEAPSTDISPAGFSTLYTDHYFGVFPVGTTPTYSIAYHYSGNTSIATDKGLRLAGRTNNSSTWFDLSASLNQSTTTLSQTGISAFSGISTTEFIPGMNNEPIIGAIPPQTIDEDGIISSLPITATDAETASCGLNITFNSSDTALVPVDNISYTCSANTYYLSITPINNLTGTCDITITLTDAGGLTASDTLALTVADVNDVPLISTISDQTTIEDFAVGSISLTVADIEDAACSMDITITSSDTVLIPNDNMTYTCTSNTYWLTITPAADQNGLATITFTVIDSGALTAAYSFDLTITAINDAPVLVNPISNRIATEGIAYAYTIPSNTFTDVDSGDVLTYTATQVSGSALPGWLSFNPSSRLFSGLPTNSDVGSITITITATDGSAQSITDTFVLSVNNTNSAPVLDTPIADQTIDEDVPYSFTFAADTFRDDDIAFGDTITYTAMLADGSPLPDWLTFDVNNRHFSGTPTNDDAIGYTITVIASDTLNLTAADSFYLTVVNINDAPVIHVLSQDIALTSDEDTIIHSIPFTVTDLETATCSLDITFVSSNTNLLSVDNMSYTCNAETFYLSFTPALNQSGNAIIAITVTDGSLSASTAFALTVNEINDAPEISTLSDAIINEDTAVSINFSISDTESDASTLTLSTSSSNQTLVAPENISISGTGTNRTISIMPADSEYGIVEISVSVSDGDLTSTTSFALTVTQINDAPVFEARSMIFIGNGEYHNYALDNSGAVWGWGNNASNQITSQTTLNQSYPVKIPDLDNVISLTGGLEHSLALKSDGTVWAWGANAEGQLGDGSNSDKATPVQVLNLSNIIEIAANQNRSMALESDGTVWAWGNNTGGRLGDGTTTDRNAPVELTILTNIVQISIGFNHNLALKNDNTVWAWGKNSNGELGDGTITDRSSPIEITAISNVIMVSAGRYFSIALLNDGTVMAWGKNQAGQLGDASNLDRLTPVQVSGLTNVTFITAFSNFSHALKSDGSVWGWGNNTDGRLGDDSTANKNSPVQIFGLNDLMMISHGTNHSLALSYDGTVRAWGTNDHGQLGDRTTLEKHIPTLVPIDVYAIFIEEDTAHTITEIITDAESSPCDLTLTLLSSDPVLFTNANLTDTCNADTYAINITPTTNMDGIATLTIIAADAEGLTSAKSLTVTVTPVNDTPVITSDVTFTMNEDAISILTLTATDAESADCSMDITFASSNTNLLPVENISYTCASGVYHISIMPESNQSGNTALTITITDSGNMTATQAIALTVLEFNDPPQMGSIADQTTLEDIATSVISFTVADNETPGCSMTLSMTSSDQTLVPDEYLLSMCSSNHYSIVATPAMNQYGMATISVTITDAGGLTSQTSFDLTVTDVDDSSYIWANFQAAESVLGQTDFISVTGGTTDVLMNHPANVAVDPTTGKVFVCDGLNHRILRFSATDALFNGSSAEAVLGQVNYTSGSANRGTGVNVNTFNNPTSAWVDTFGRLWVADQANHRVLRFDNASSKTDGADADAVLGQTDFTTATAGTTQNQLKGPGSVWVDAFGCLWVSDSNNHRVLRFDTPELKANGANADAVLGQNDFTTATSGLTQSKFNIPLIVRGDNNGSLFVSDVNNNRVLRFDNAHLKNNGDHADAVLGQSSFTTNTARTTADGMSNPRSVAVDHAGHLYVAENNNRRIIIYKDAVNKADGASADYVLGQPDFTSNTQNNGGISERSLNNVHYIFFDNQSSHLWVPDYSNYRVLRFSMMTKIPPEMGLMSDITMDEDMVSDAVSFTVTDINEQPLTITYNSSDTSLISATSISFTGDQVSTDGTNYTVTASAIPTNITLFITPESNQSGTAYITTTVTDPNGMTATQSFSLNVIAVNDVPTLSTVNPQSLNEGTSIDITLTATDIENDALSVTAVSSNQSLIQDSDILLANDGNTYTITISPMVNQSGSTNITVSVSDGTDVTSMTFLITVNEVYYMIAGHVSWYTNIAGSDLKGVTLTLSGTHSYSMVTDATGYYTFSTVRPGDYTLTASKSDDINLEIADAIKILKVVVRKIGLNCLEKIAADAYNDGYIGAYDAAKILDYLAGYSNCLNDNCTFWQFVTEDIISCGTFPLIEFEDARRYTDLTGDFVGQDFIGVGCGNVSE